MIRTDIEIPKNIKYLGEIRNIELPYGTFTRFTHYMYRMKTTSNKLITNIL